MGRVYLFKQNFDYDGIRDMFFGRYAFGHCMHCKLESCCAFLFDLNDAVRLDG